MSFIDLAIVIATMGGVLASAIYVRRFTRSVADYLSANRCAGRYLLTVADGISGLGAVTVVALWEKFYQGGLAALHWGTMLAPITLILAMSGWVIYRYRQTRAMTLAQFFERRYSRRFRVFAGFMCFTAGLLNYGIFPAVTGRFLIYFTDLPVYSSTFWGIELNWTLGVVMAFMLGLALVVTLNGGQIAVMVSDFLQGQLANICFLVLLVVLLWLIPWPTMLETLKSAPAGQSKINPFDQNELPDFSPIYFLMMSFITVYIYKVWQGSQGYNASATSPHEAKMALVLAQFRGLVTFLLIPIAAVAAWTLLNGTAQPEATAAAQMQLDHLAATGGEQLAAQLTTTVALRELLPVGVLGLLTVVMLMAALSTDSTYLHSWGSIFIQDVLSPIRQAQGKPRLTPQQHLRWLRQAAFLVAVFAWTFSILFPVQEYILMYFQATGAIFTGGAGAVLIGGLYWRRGSTSAAWTAMIVGSVLSVAGVLLINIGWPSLVPWLKDTYPGSDWIARLPEDFYLNGLEWAFCISLLASSLYVIVSLLSRQKPIDFDKLYYRGEYAVAAAEGEPDYVPQVDKTRIAAWRRWLGITEEHTRGDLWIYGLKYAVFVWTFVIGFLGLTVAYLLGFMRSDESWSIWWTISVASTALMGAVTTVWFLIGGFKDLFVMIRRLRTLQRDATDDGTVTEHLADSS